MASEQALGTAAAAPSRLRILPWTQQLHDAHPVAPWKSGACVTLVLAVAFTAFELALGRQHLLPDQTTLRNIRLAYVMFLTVGFALGASLHLVAQARRTLAELLPRLTLPPAEAAALLEATGRFSRGGLWRAGLFGLAISVLVPLLADPPRVLYDPRHWLPEMYWHRIVVLALGWWISRLLMLVVVQSLRLRDLTRALPELDLFDLSILRPFTRQTLTHVLALAGLGSILTLNLIEEGFGAMVALLTLQNAGLAALAVWAPLAPIRDRVREAKERALAWCRGELASAAGGLVAERETAERGRVADLVAYETRVGAVPEWPFDAGAVGRLAFYLLIPILSWSGGAVVERWIDALLD
jgi:hypothetical protein